MNLSTLDPLIRQHTLLKHPFYLRWSAGQLSREDLRTYALEYFHLVERVPGFVARVKDRLHDRALRDHAARNEVEEREHVELWKRFAKSLGVSEAELAAHMPSAEVRAAADAIDTLCERDVASGVAALYALELELPEIARTKKEGLLNFYGLSSDDAHVYFDEHLGEEKHLALWRGFTVDTATATAAARGSLDAQHAVLDAVCAARGIPLHC